jgi:hypothetical protein
MPDTWGLPARIRRAARPPRAALVSPRGGVPEAGEDGRHLRVDPGERPGDMLDHLGQPIVGPRGLILHVGDDVLQQHRHRAQGGRFMIEESLGRLFDRLPGELRGDPTRIVDCKFGATQVSGLATLRKAGRAAGDHAPARSVRGSSPQRPLPAVVGGALILPLFDSPPPKLR